jgi:hypothetical protein
MAPKKLEEFALGIFRKGRFFGHPFNKYGS